MESTTLDRNNPKPLYRQLRDIIDEKISSGEWKPGDRIPSENELSRQYGLSRMTARAVLQELVKEERLYRVQGKGTFVAEQKIEAQSLRYVGIREQLEKLGYAVETKTLFCGLVSSDRDVAKHLGVAEGAPVFMIRRVRSIQGKPISIHVSYILEQYSKGLSPEILEQEQLCVLMNEFFGLCREGVHETLESVVADWEEAKLLEVERGHPLLMLKDELFSEDGLAYEYTKVVFRGDKVKIRLSFDK